MEWLITARVYPFSTGKGSEIDLASCGGRYHRMRVTAPDFAQASGHARAFAKGLSCNPNVWTAEVVGVLSMDVPEEPEVPPMEAEKKPDAVAL